MHFHCWFTHSDCLPDLSPKKIYGDAQIILMYQVFSQF